ncbi:MAG TPA: sugar transferase [Patescibacteria group bacterium]|nr:sugar transferase [Patescibacteria group bacterium]
MTRKKALFWWLLLSSMVVFYISLAVGLVVRFHEWDGSRFFEHAAIFSPLFLLWALVFFVFGLYEVRVFRRYVQILGSLFSALIACGLLSVIYFYTQPNLSFTPRRVLLFVLVAAHVLFVLLYLAVKRGIKNRLLEYVYMLKQNNFSQSLKSVIEEQDFLGYRFAGYLDVPEPRITHRDSTVVFPDNAHDDSISKLYQLRNFGVKFVDEANFYEQVLRRVNLLSLHQLWFLENVSYKNSAAYDAIKRFVDVILGMVGLLFFAITFPLIALVIVIDSRGPVFFVQPRVGLNGKVYNVYKYRTMTVGKGDTWTAQGDNRITRVGRFLRRTRIDELPQMINLAAGNMSLVGPRPEQVHIVEQLKQQIPFYDERHLVKPGVTGWAQINDTYAASLEETKDKLEYDLYYVKHRSLLFDLEIILKTIYYILWPRGR